MLTRFTTTPFLCEQASGTPSRHLDRVPACGRQSTRLTRVWSLLVEAWCRHRSRQLLSGLDAHMLKDIGVTFAEAEHEANKWFWMR